MTSLRRPIPRWIVIAFLALLYYFGQGPYQLGFKPPVYHDEFVVAEGREGIFERGSPSTYDYNSSEPLETILEGKGRLNIVVDAGFHYLFSGWTVLFGKSAFAARLFPSLCSLFVALLLFRLGKILFSSNWVGFFASLWWLLDSSVTQAARQLRPEVPTCLMYMTACWILWEWGRKKKWALPVAGLFTGLGMTLHPVGVILLPSVILSSSFSGSLQRSRRKGIVKFLGGVSVFCIPYILFIWLKREDVLTMLHLNAAQRALPEIGYLGRMIALLKGAYPNAYQLKVGICHALLFSLATSYALGLGIVGHFKKDPSLRSVACASFSSLLAFLLLPLIGRDYFNFLYLTHLWPWVFLTAAWFLVRVIKKFFPRFSPAIFFSLIALNGALFSFTYLAEARGLESFHIAGYDQVIRPLSAQIEGGSYILGTPNAIPLVRQSHGIFIPNEMYLQWRPQYKRYPVEARREGSHTLTYSFNPQVLKDLNKEGINVYYHLDRYDWAWNIYYPFGSKYAASYVQLRQGLGRWFKLVATSYSRQRGRVELWRYGKKNEESPPLYVEGKPVFLGESLPQGKDRSFQVNQGSWYWLEMEVSCHGGAVAVFVIDGRTYEKYFDAPVPIPLDYVFQARGPRMGVEEINLAHQGNIRINKMSLKEVKFAE